MERTVYPQRKGGTGRFFAGLFTGIFISVILAGAGAFYLFKNPQKLVKVAEKEAGKVIRRTVNSVPKDYLAERQTEISELFSRFIKAYSLGQIHAESMDGLTQLAFAAASDQKVTSEEIDQLLVQMQEVLKATH